VKRFLGVGYRSSGQIIEVKVGSESQKGVRNGGITPHNEVSKVPYLADGDVTRNEQSARYHHHLRILLGFLHSPSEIPKDKLVGYPSERAMELVTPGLEVKFENASTLYTKGEHLVKKARVYGTIGFKTNPYPIFHPAGKRQRMSQLGNGISTEETHTSHSGMKCPLKLFHAHKRLSALYKIPVVPVLTEEAVKITPTVKYS